MSGSTFSYLEIATPKKTTVEECLFKALHSMEKAPERWESLKKIKPTDEQIKRTRSRLNLESLEEAATRQPTAILGEKTQNSGWEKLAVPVLPP